MMGIIIVIMVAIGCRCLCPFLEDEDGQGGSVLVLTGRILFFFFQLCAFLT